MLTISAVHFLGGQFHLVALAYRKVSLTHPEEAGFEAVGLDRGVRFVRGHMAALDENLLGQRDADAFAGHGVSRVRRVQRSMLSTTLVLALGEKTSVSPTRSVPDSMRPAMMRRSSKR